MILLEEISQILSQADTESFVGGAGTDLTISHHPPCALEGKIAVERGDESPGGVAEQLVSRGRGVNDEEPGAEADIKDEDVDVVCGAPALASSMSKQQSKKFSKYKSQTVCRAGI